MKLWQKVLLGLSLGVIFGMFFPEYAEYIKPIGDIFLRLIKMIIAPLIFFSLLTGITSIEDPATLGRIGKKAVAGFLGTTFFAILFGMVMALTLQPGYGVHLNFGQNATTVAAPFDLIVFIENIVPESAVGTFTNGNILAVVFLAIFTGLVLNKMGSIAQPVKDFSSLLSKITLKMIAMIVELSPYAVFGLTAWSVSTNGLGVMGGLFKLVGAIFLAMSCQYLIFGLLIYAFCRISPLPFYKKSLEYQVVAFSTASSKAALGTTMQVCRERLGISSASTSFLVPLGASINMVGFAINLSLVTIFFAQALGVHLALHDYLIIMLTTTVGTIGGAGIPGANLVILPMVMASVGLPVEGVALIAGIDRILDMVRTTINITGDATVSLIVDNSEGTFNKEMYFSEEPATRRSEVQAQSTSGTAAIPGLDAA